MSKSIVPLPPISFKQLEEGTYMSVANYFYWKLGEQLDRTLTDKHLEPMPIDSPCGIMCREAIDAARALYPYSENAGEGYRCIDVARQAVLVMMNG